ncbi:MAG: TIGR04076 family protein [Halobacteriaceae archaeon]
MAEPGDGEFELYDLRVECVEITGEPVANYDVGDYFEVHGGKLVFPDDQDGFSLYALASLLPLLPAKQRETEPDDWMTTDTRVAGPDPNVGGVFEITRLDKQRFSHGDVSGEDRGDGDGREEKA